MADLCLLLSLPRELPLWLASTASSLSETSWCGRSMRGQGLKIEPYIFPLILGFLLFQQTVLQRERAKKTRARRASSSRIAWRRLIHAHMPYIHKLLAPQCSGFHKALEIFELLSLNIWAISRTFVTCCENVFPMSSDMCKMLTKVWRSAKLCKSCTARNVFNPEKRIF